METLIRYLAIFCPLYFTAQTGLFINGNGASLRVESAAFLSVDGEFRNMNCDPISQVRFNGPLYLSGDLINNDSLKFAASTPGTSVLARLYMRTSASYTAGQNAIIGGTVPPKLWSVTIEKNAGNVQLLNDVRCWDTLEFKYGNLVLNNHAFELMDPVGAPSVTNHPWIKNERNGSGFMPAGLTDSGKVVYRTIFTTSLHINPANMGIEIKGPVDFGSDVNFYRGFLPQQQVAKAGISAYFSIHSPAYGLVSNTVNLRYYGHDMLYQSPGLLNQSKLRLYVSPGTDLNWTALPVSSQNTLVSGSVQNGMLSAGLSVLSHPNIAMDGKNIRLTVADPDCVSSPVSGLLADTLHICAGKTVTLDAGNNSGITNTALKWEWETASPSFQRTLAITPDTIFHKYRVQIKNARGCVTVDSIVMAPQAPYPQITYLNHLNACFGDSVTIKDTVKIASGSFSNFWQYSDSSMSSHLQNLFRKKFPTVGNYSLQLTAISDHGCETAASIPLIVVYPPPTAAFSFSHNCVSDAVTFTSSSVSNHTALVISGYDWNLGMGSGNTSSTPSPSQTYTSAGSYYVQLTATSSFGCKDSVTDTVVIHPRNISSFSRHNVCLGDAVSFQDLSACNTGSCVLAWHFGDGTQATGANPQKTYTSVGAYNVKQIVTGPVGCPDSSTATVFVHHVPQAGFFSSASALCVNNPVYFTNTSSLASGSITSNLWSYNANAGGTSINGIYSYTAAGNYVIGLVVTSDSGCVSSHTQAFTSLPQPQSQFSVSTVCEGQATQFVSSSTGTGLYYDWNYGTGISSGTVTGATSFYQYHSAGQYSAGLIVIDSNNCSDTAHVLVTVLAKPSVDLGSVVSSCGTSYTFDAQNPGSTYLWLPGNEQTQVIAVYNDGSYSVAVTATNGCVGQASVVLTLNDEVWPDLGNDTTVCGPFTLNAGYPNSVYLWNAVPGPQHFMATASGTYIVQVTDVNQCSGNDTIVLTVLEPATVFLAADTSMCARAEGWRLEPEGNATVFKWNNGAETKTINISVSGWYWVEGTAMNGCKAKDSISVTVKPTPVVSLGNDTSSCGSLLLDAKNAGAEYLWSDGSKENALNIQSSGKYYVLVTDKINGCSNSDTIDVTIHSVVKVNLGNDTSICGNTSFKLDAGNAGSVFKWVNGLNTQTIAVTQPGMYGVQVTSKAGCSGSDYLNIHFREAPEVELGAATQYICGNRELLLTSPYSGGNEWGTAQGIFSGQQQIAVSAEGEYWLRVEQNGCLAGDTVSVFFTTHTIQAMFLASTMDTVNRPVKFVNLSEPDPLQQTWYFGDGHTSTEFSPVHTYILPTDFSVTLEVSNGYCSDRVTKSLSVLFRKKPADELRPAIKLDVEQLLLYPNPGSNQILLDLKFNMASTLQVRIADMTGRIVATQEFQEMKEHFQIFDISPLAGGLYIMSLRSAGLKGEVTRTLKFIKTD